MFKVSFKKEGSQPSKTVERIDDKVTVVTLRGTIKLPDWFWKLPFGLKDKLYKSNKYIRCSVPLGDCIYIVVKGFAKRADEDIYDPIIGERIAEARAKIELYKLMEKATDGICRFLFKYLYGSSEITGIFHNSYDGGIYQTHKKYQALLIKESHHLGKLLEEA